MLTGKHATIIIMCMQGFVVSNIHTTVDSHYSARVITNYTAVGGAGDTVRSGSSWIDIHLRSYYLVMQRLSR